MEDLSFKLFLERTISDILSSLNQKIKPIKLEVKNFLQTQLSGRDLDTAVNLFSYIYYNEGIRDIKKDWEKFKDYLNVNLSHNRTLFVNPLTMEQLEDLNEKYHINLKISNKNLRKGPSGKELIDVSKQLTELNKTLSLPGNFKSSLWNGWKWVSLGCGYSSEEGAAAGHCGNSSNNIGDNIFSLRNPNSQVLLTFIVNTNTGAVGESKALNNEKPSKDLHPAIAALLSSKYVKKIEGGGYDPESNFTIEDFNYNKNLYEYFAEHLKGDKVHETPENYLPLSWLKGLTDEVIHVKYPTAQKKSELLDDILNVFSNYRIFDSEDGKQFAPMTIRFNLDKLIKDCLNSNELNTKHLLDLYSKVSRIYASNRVWDKHSAEVYRPDLKDEDIPQDKEGSYLSYIKKLQTVSVDTNTIKYVLQKILNKKLNLRDKSILLKNTSRAAGYGYSDLPEDTGVEFSDTIKNIMEDILRECLKLKEIPRFVGQEIIDYLASHINEKFRNIGINFNYKKQTIEFTTYTSSLRYGYDETSDERNMFIKAIMNNYSNIKQNFIKKGIPADREKAKEIICNCAWENFSKEFFIKLEQILSTNYGFIKVEIKKYDTKYLKKSIDVKKALQNAINGNPTTLPKQIQDEISKARNNLFLKMTNNINKWLKNSFNKIFGCTKDNFKLVNNVRITRHSKKNRYETPEQLAKIRRTAKDYFRQRDSEAAIKEFEARRRERIRKMADELKARMA